MTKKKSKDPPKRDEDAGPPNATLPPSPADFNSAHVGVQPVRKKKTKRNKKEKEKVKQPPQAQPEIRPGIIVVFKKRGRKGDFKSHPFWVRSVIKSKAELRCITTFGNRTLTEMREEQKRLIKLGKKKRLNKKQLTDLGYDLDHYLGIPGSSKGTLLEDTGKPELDLCSKGKSKKKKMPKRCYVEYNVFDPTRHIVDIGKLKPYRRNKFALTPHSSQIIDHFIMIAKNTPLQRPTDCLPVAAVGNADML